ncbi:twitching motility protein PilT [Nocardia fluminea]|uniref:twitching motility protein PilT n=1 Tax=Nocardia fluminea TaxID=134984 RepID=UPI00342EED21
MSNRRLPYFAERYALRGDDVIHCAAAAQLEDSDLVAASGDRKLLTAWKELGIAAFDSNAAGL